MNQAAVAGQHSWVSSSMMDTVLFRLLTRSKLIIFLVASENFLFFLSPLEAGVTTLTGMSSETLSGGVSIYSSEETDSLAPSKNSLSKI